MQSQPYYFRIRFAAFNHGRKFDRRQKEMANVRENELLHAAQTVQKIKLEVNAEK